MFSELGINNFKGFGGNHSIPLRPLTLVFGPNSSGKSSIIQSLLLLSQSGSSDCNAPLTPKGDLVNLGSFRELVHRHDESRECEFRLMLDEDLSRPGSKFLGKLVGERGISISVGTNSETGELIMSRFCFHYGDRRRPLLTFSRKKRPPHGGSVAVEEAWLPLIDHVEVENNYLYLESVDKDSPFWLEFNSGVFDEYENNIKKGMKNELRRLRRLESDRVTPMINDRIEILKRELAESTSLHDLKVDEIISIVSRVPFWANGMAHKRFSSRDYFLLRALKNGKDGTLIQSAVSALLDLILASSRRIGSLLDSVKYIGPLREYPERYYVFSGTRSDTVGKTGGLSADLLFRDRELLDRVNAGLKAFGFDYSMRLLSTGSAVPELQDVYSLRLFDSISNTHANISDVGFGISQVLPVLVQTYLSTNKLILIEQPEIHLHPRLQAELGSLFCDAIKFGSGNNFVIETHSQHLLLRVQRLIREGAFSSNDLAVLYVDRTHRGSNVVEMRLDSSGRFIDAWPSGFFEDGYREMFS